jgi:hypothetical protein
MENVTLLIEKTNGTVVALNSIPVIAETEKAIEIDTMVFHRIRIGVGKTTAWLPKSQLNEIIPGAFLIPEWLYEKTYALKNFPSKYVETVAQWQKEFDDSTNSAAGYVDRLIACEKPEIGFHMVGKVSATMFSMSRREAIVAAIINTENTEEVVL